MAESNATERFETCVRHHSRTCTCGIDEKPCPECGQPAHSPGDCYVPVSALEGVTVAGARAFWHAKDIEAKHEALRADVMTVVSDPHLTWERARQALRAALSK